LQSEKGERGRERQGQGSDYARFERGRGSSGPSIIKQAFTKTRKEGGDVARFFPHLIPRHWREKEKKKEKGGMVPLYMGTRGKDGDYDATAAEGGKEGGGGGKKKRA